MVQLMHPGQFPRAYMATTMGSRARGLFLAGGTLVRGASRFAGMRRRRMVHGVVGGFRGMFR